MDRGALEWFDLQVLLFSQSVSFHQCSILIFIYMLLLPEGQTGEAWESSKKQQSNLCYDSDCVAMNELEMVQRKRL